MNRLLLCDRWDKRGGAPWTILSVLSHYEDVQLENYNSASQKTGVFLGYNFFPDNVKSNRKIRKFLFVGGGKMNANGVPRPVKWNALDHVFFISEFYRRIAKSVSKIKRSSVMHVLGGAPADPLIAVPLTAGKRLEQGDIIHFVIIAKWWKRKFKRLSQTVYFFNNFIQKEYPNSILHVLGMNIEKDKKEGNVKYYRKTFHKDVVIDIYRKSHIHLMLSPFDTGPMTLNESMHYRVPFVCSNNCCGSELLDKINGVCGEVVRIDKPILSAAHCKKYKPMTNKKVYGKKLPYEQIMESVKRIVDNYDEYTGWNWTKQFNYKNHCKIWMDNLFG